MTQNFSFSIGTNNLKLFLYLRNSKRMELGLQLVAVQCLRKLSYAEHFLELNIVGGMKSFDPVN